MYTTFTIKQISTLQVSTSFYSIKLTKLNQFSSYLAAMIIFKLCLFYKPRTTCLLNDKKYCLRPLCTKKKFKLCIHGTVFKTLFF